MPSVSHQMSFRRRRARKSMAALNAMKGEGWRLTRTWIAAKYDEAHAQIAADETQSRDALAAWANEGGAR